jgi:uncharacterized membrane protein YccF (DUF307 family)
MKKRMPHMVRLAIPRDQDLLCPGCDTRNTGDALFCVGCGGSLQAASTVPARQTNTARWPGCAVCGNSNPAQAVYCVTCGCLLEGGLASGFVPTFAGPQAAIVQNIYVTALPTPAELPIGIRALWFLFVGLWAGQIWLLIAWLLNMTLIGLPLGLWMLNVLPQVMTLRQERRGLQKPTDHSGASFAVRAIYFVLIGWWLSLIWLELAWLASATIIGLPIGFLMFERVGTLTTLADA